MFLKSDRLAGHGGATLGQLSLFKMVPDRAFALVSCTNCSPVGNDFNERVMQWAWETLLGASLGLVAATLLFPLRAEPAAAQPDAN